MVSYLNFFLLVSFLSLGIFTHAADVEISGDIFNKNVERSVDLTSQFVRQTLKVTVGNNGAKAANAYYFAIEQSADAHLSLFETFEDSVPLKTTKVATVDASADKKGYTLYQVDLPKALNPDSSANLRIVTIFSHSLTPFPQSIGQNEKQFVVFNDNHFFFSPYTTQSQKTDIKVPGLVESKTDLKPSSFARDTISYGPYEDIKPFSYSPLKIHFENNKPFITVTSLVKEIEISHWGNVAVEETYQLQHDGARLKGTFSRFDYQRNPGASAAAVPVMRQLLPEGASDVYYRDEIGNITTSHLSLRESGSKRYQLFELAPRYPLFGGWKAAFYMGYNLPLSQYLSTDVKDSSLFVLNISVSSTFEDAVIDDLTVRVILPEGARNGKVHAPFEIFGESIGVHYTYLDTSGRPVLIFKKKNLVPELNKFFQVTYNFSSLSMFQEPFLLIGAFFFFFVFIMLWVRLEFSIGPVKTRSAQAAQVEEFLLKFREIVEQRSEHHDTREKLLSKFRSTRNEADYNSGTTQVSKNLKTLREEASKVISSLETLDAEVAKKLREVEKKQVEKEKAQEDASAAIRGGKNADELVRKYNNLDEEIQSVVSILTENF